MKISCYIVNKCIKSIRHDYMTERCTYDDTKRRAVKLANTLDMDGLTALLIECCTDVTSDWCSSEDAMTLIVGNDEIKISDRVKVTKGV